MGELKHYGVKGMKWGVIRSKEGRADARQSRKLKRHVAASKKNLKEKAQLHDDDNKKYDDATENYKKELSRPSFNKAVKRERVNEASKLLSAAGDKMVRSKADLKRASKIYKEDADAFKEHTDLMMKKYGEENVRSLSTKTLKVGSTFVDNVLKTGLTLSELPIIGTYYNGRYIGKREYTERVGAIEEKSNERYY